jgi:hypothetical protein
VGSGFSRPITIAAGSAASVRVTIPPAYCLLANLAFELSDPPEGISLQDRRLDAAGAAFVLRADAATVKPGARGNLIAAVTGERVPPPNVKQATPAAAPRRLQAGTLPAIRYEITR